MGGENGWNQTIAFVGKSKNQKLYFYTSYTVKKKIEKCETSGTDKDWDSRRVRITSLDEAAAA